MWRTFMMILAIAAVVAAVSAANLLREPGSVALDWQLVKPLPVEVIVEAPARGPIVQTVTAPGKVESVEEAEIASQLIGRVLAVNVKEGDAVKRGDVLVKLDPTDARARLDSSIAKIERLREGINQAENDLAKANRDANLSGRLSGKGFATPTEVADSRTALAKSHAAYSMSKHDLVESEAMRRTYEQDLTRTEIRAPIDGVVAGLNVDVGEIVIAGTTNLPGSVLMTVSDLNRMRVRADVDETDVPMVRRGQTSQIFLQADPLHPVVGIVDMIAPKGKVKSDVVCFETLVHVEPITPGSDPKSTPAMRPAMTATVEIEVRRSPDALGVPAQAVVHRRRKDLPDTPAVREWAARNARSTSEKTQEADLRYIKIVFVVEGAVARARPVETGLSDERRVEILSGIQPNDKVIVGPFRALDELKDGSSVLPAKNLTEEVGKS
jgi:HlyD family secretion protein